MFKMYARRKAIREKKGVDVFQYDKVPPKLRAQIVHIAGNVIGNGISTMSYNYNLSVYRLIENKVFEEEGLFFLPWPDRSEFREYEDSERVFNYMLNADTDQALGVIELLCFFLENVCSNYNYVGDQDAEGTVRRAIDSINSRFRESGCGYQYTDGEIIWVDPQLLHGEAVVPALEVLRLPGFEGPQAEFLKAHEHYRHGRNSEALVECAKSFESIMKSICDKREWKYDKNKMASHLIEICLKNGLIPSYHENYMTGLRMILDSAVPTPRNKTAAHGAGSVPVVVPPELASYVIHLTASTLLFLANADKAKP